MKQRPVLRVLRGMAEAAPEGGVLAQASAEVLSAQERGFLSETIFYPAPFDAGVGQVLSSCRFVAGSLEDLIALDRAAAQAGFSGVVKVGLRLQAPDLPRAEHVVLLDELPQLAHEIKSLRHLTVRGCFFCGDLNGVHGKALGKFFRSGYEAAKRMTVTLPCAMPYLCYEGAVSAINQNAKEHPETLHDCLLALDIMTMQNETAFYAKLWLS